MSSLSLPEQDVILVFLDLGGWEERLLLIIIIILIITTDTETVKALIHCKRLQEASKSTTLSVLDEKTEKIQT